MAWPEEGKVTIKSLAKGNQLLEGSIEQISIVGVEAEPNYDITEEGLTITLPKEMTPSNISFVVKIETK